MNARPILFSGEMVRALLEGRKTQTRRIVRPQPESHLAIPRHLGGGEWQWCAYREQLGDVVPTWRCPYGQPGDLLWVRERWTFVNVQRRGDQSELVVAYNADGADLPNR
ncbi:MAG TPA: hypothetical protein VF202_14315, partial [Trueperaceae bacterium]